MVYAFSITTVELFFLKKKRRRMGNSQDTCNKNARCKSAHRKIGLTCICFSSKAQGHQVDHLFFIFVENYMV